MNLVEAVVGALIGAVVVGAGTWLAFARDAVTIRKLDEYLKPLRASLGEAVRVSSEAIRKTDKIVERKEIDEMIVKRAPWTSEKDGVMHRLDNAESRTETLAQAFIDVSTRLSNIEGLLQRAINNGDGK